MSKNHLKNTCDKYGAVIDKNLTVKQGADEMGSTSISNKWINVGSPYTHIHFKEAQA